MSEIVVRYRLELVEDLHTGTGVGKLGIVDDTQSRDQQGKPTIWASTLRGLLREAGEDWLLALEKIEGSAMEVKSERELLDRLLGQGGNDRGIATIRSLHLDSGKSLLPPFVQWMSTARVAYNRRPDDKTLRRVEHGRAGLVGDGEIRVPGQLKDQLPAIQLLKRCLKRLMSLGSSKSRGWGLVRLEREPADVELPGPSTGPELPLAVQSSGSVVMRLLLRNLEPLNLAATALAGNQIESQSFIAGTRLRGAILRWLTDRGYNFLQAENIKVGDALFVPVRKNPVSKETLAQMQALPLPLSIRQPKGGQGHAEGSYAGRTPWWNKPDMLSKNLRKEEERDVLACPIPREEESDSKTEPKTNADPHKDLYPNPAEYKRVKTEDYLFRMGEHWQRVRPRMGVLMRNQVPTQRRDGIKRSFRREETAALFGEQVLWEDQTFVADLHFDNQEVAEQFARASRALFHPDLSMRSWLRVGRGGRPVRIEEWTFNPAPGACKNLDDHMTLTLTSDLIARTPWLTFLTELTVIDLKRLIEEAGGIRDPK